MVLWTTFFSLQLQANFLVGEKNLLGSGSGLRFLAGSGFNQYGSETLDDAVAAYLGCYRYLLIKLKYKITQCYGAGAEIMDKGGAGAENKLFPQHWYYYNVEC